MKLNAKGKGLQVDGDTSVEGGLDVSVKIGAPQGEIKSLIGVSINFGGGKIGKLSSGGGGGGGSGGGSGGGGGGSEPDEPNIDGHRILTTLDLSSNTVFDFALTGDVVGSGSTVLDLSSNTISMSIPTTLVLGANAAVLSFNGRAGNIVLSNTDIANALGYTPVSPSSVIANAAFASNAGQLNGQDASYYLNASNIGQGTLPAGRLSGTYNIDISGNAATATNASYANSAGFAQNTANAVYANSAGYTTTANNANYAGRLNTARTITLSGDVTGNVAFDGSANVTISTTLAGGLAAYAKLAGPQTFSNTQIFTGFTQIASGQFQVTGTNPYVTFYDNGGPANNRYSAFMQNGDTFQLNFMDDGWNAASTALQIHRSNNNATSMIFNGNMLRVRTPGTVMGYAALYSGDANRSGYLNFFAPDGTDIGYIGYANDTTLNISAYSGRTINFNHRPSFAGNTPWDSGNFNPSSYIHNNVDYQTISGRAFYLGNGRGISLGYTGGEYGGVGYNVNFSSTSGIYTAPMSDTASLLSFGSGGMSLRGAGTGAVGRNISWTELLVVPLSGDMTFRGQTVYHSGNLPAGSTDAQTLDGLDSAAFVQKFVSKPGGTDMNTITDSGFYRMQDSFSNGPGGGGGYGNMIVSRGNDTQMQIYANYSTPDIWWRSGHSVGTGSWGGAQSWRSLHHSGRNSHFDNPRYGMVGFYDASQTQMIFAMGESYILPGNGASNNYGSFYGLGWSYNPDYGAPGNNPQSKAGLNHQMLLMLNGVTQTAIGTGIWSIGNIQSQGIITSASGFQTTSYLSNQRNRIWSFNNADGYGLSYFQNSGQSSGDSMGFHFGTASSAGSAVNFTEHGVELNTNGALYSWGQSAQHGAVGPNQIVMPAGGSGGYNDNVKTGAIKIRLPLLGYGGMVKFRVEVFNYSTGLSKSFMISGYPYNSDQQWYNVSVEQFGDADSVPLNVRFGAEGGYSCVWIGETNTSWYYPQIWVSHYFHGYSGWSKNLTRNWQVSIETAFGTVYSSRAAAMYWNTNNLGVSDNGVNYPNRNRPVTFDGSGFVNMRVIGNYGPSTQDGMYIGYANANGGTTRIYGGGGTANYIGVESNYAHFNSNRLWYSGNIPNDSWQTSVDGHQRFYFGSSGHTYYKTASGHVFRTPGDADAVVIDSAGAASFTNTVTGTTIYMHSWFRSTGATGWYNETYAGGIYMEDTSWVRVYNGKSFVCSATIQATNVIATSDIKLKKNVTDLTEALDLIKRIKVRRFNWKLDGRADLGVIAQEIEEVLPEVVRDGADDVKTVNYNAMGVVAIAGVQELMAQIEELKARLAAAGL